MQSTCYVVNDNKTCVQMTTTAVHTCFFISTTTTTHIVCTLHALLSIPTTHIETDEASPCPRVTPLIRRTGSHPF